MALRRERDGADWLTLPAAGRTKRAPAWPLAEAARRERTLWTRLWKLPQATEWERLQQHFEVAIYVRRLIECEEPGTPAALSTLVRQYADSLGLTTPGMQRNRWRVATAREAEPGPAPAASSGTGAAARDRFRLVKGG